MSKAYLGELEAPTRSELEATRGSVLVEFGTDWCGYCLSAQPKIAQAIAPHTQLPHFKVEDGPGRALGRSYHVKLWPTLIVLLDGQEVARVVRPNESAEIALALKG